MRGAGGAPAPALTAKGGGAGWVHRDQPTGSDTDHHDGDGALLMQTFAADGEAEGEGEGERGTDTTVGEAPHATS